MLQIQLCKMPSSDSKTVAHYLQPSILMIVECPSTKTHHFRVQCETLITMRSDLIMLDENLHHYLNSLSPFQAIQKTFSQRIENQRCTAKI